MLKYYNSYSSPEEYYPNPEITMTMKHRIKNAIVRASFTTAER